jgi:hypothetical protein
MNNQEKMAATIELLDIFDHYGVPGDRASQLLKDINLITAKFAKREKTEANIGESTMEMIRLFKRFVLITLYSITTSSFPTDILPLLLP